MIFSAVAFGERDHLARARRSAGSPATFRERRRVEHAQLCSVPSLPHALAAPRPRPPHDRVLDAERSISDEDLTGPVAPSSARKAGLRPRASEILRARTFPMRGPRRHNVSAAAAIALYETRRQRDKKI